MLTPWFPIFYSIILTATAVDAASSSTGPLIPKTASGPPAPSQAPAIPSGPKIPHVKRPTVKDVYDDGDLSAPRLCRKDDNILLRVLSDLCPVPIEKTAAQLPPASWSPWTHPPACSEVNKTSSATSDPLLFCVFTHAQYNGGISIVATPETASGLAVLLDKASIAQQTQPIDRPLLEIKDIPGKGLGMVAGQAIPRGTVLFRDQARILADVRFPQHVRRTQGQKLLHKAAGRLPVPDDVRALSRSVKAKPGEALGVLEENVLSTNSFAATVDGVAYMALFPEIARINHACNPTAMTRFNDKDLTQQVIAFRDIEAGEEITISYTDFGLTHDARQETLKRRWGFECTCSMCSGGPDAAAASDARRKRVTALRAEVVAYLKKGAFGTAIAAYEDELLGLVRAEHLAEHMGEHYEVLARLHLAAGNQTAAVKYAEQALDELEVFREVDTGMSTSVKGSSGGSSIQELRAFVKALKGQGQPKKRKTKKPKRQKKKEAKAKAKVRKQAAKASGSG